MAAKKTTTRTKKNTPKKASPKKATTKKAPAKKAPAKAAKPRPAEAKKDPPPEPTPAKKPAVKPAAAKPPAEAAGGKPAVDLDVVDKLERGGTVTRSGRVYPTGRRRAPVGHVSALGHPNLHRANGAGNARRGRQRVLEVRVRLGPRRTIGRGVARRAVHPQDRLGLGPLRAEDN